jgi:DNA repair protein RadC
VKTLPVPDRPREKLTRAGATALGDNELVALVIGSGTRARGTLALAEDVVVLGDGLAGLTRLSIDELRRVPGVGVARAARLLAAVELGRRVLVQQAGERPRFRTPPDLAEYLMPLHAGHRLERFGVVLLDSRQRLIRTTLLSIGTDDATYATPREVYREALLASAAAVAVFHNHPSGDPTPSLDDMAVTVRLAQAGDTMGVEMVDHIILGAGRFYSFRAAGRIGPRRGF